MRPLFDDFPKIMDYRPIPLAIGSGGYHRLGVRRILDKSDRLSLVGKSPGGRHSLSANSAREGRARNIDRSHTNSLYGSIGRPRSRPFEK